jgi:YbbR domain-containing protein
MRTLTPSDVSLSIDMRGVSMGQEKVLPLTPEMVDAPFGVEVVQVIPARVRLTVEPTATRTVPIVPTLAGTPAGGFEIGRSAVTPETIQIEGPASHVANMDAIPTTPVDVRNRGANFEETVELDVQDPLVRHRSGTIKVQVQIRRAR